MRIVTLYRTSAGVFLSLDEASKKKNRPKMESYDRYTSNVREWPEPIRALCVFTPDPHARIPEDGVTEYFILSPIGVS